MRVGYRPVVLAGMGALTTAFAIFWTFGRETPRLWIVADLALLGAGLGLTMLTLLLAVQHSVGREMLGIATSMNQFSRSIGGAVGVAAMGAVLALGMNANIMAAASKSGGELSLRDAARVAENPSALVDPAAREGLSPAAVVLLQDSLIQSLRPVFLTGTGVALLGLIVAIVWLPAGIGRRQTVPPDGERMVMAEMTTLDAESEPEG